MVRAGWGGYAGWHGGLKWLVANALWADAQMMPGHACTLLIRAEGVRRTISAVCVSDIHGAASQCVADQASVTPRV